MCVCVCVCVCCVCGERERARERARVSARLAWPRGVGCPSRDREEMVVKLLPGEVQGPRENWRRLERMLEALPGKEEGRGGEQTLSLRTVRKAMVMVRPLPTRRRPRSSISRSTGISLGLYRYLGRVCFGDTAGGRCPRSLVFLSVCPWVCFCMVGAVVSCWCRFLISSPSLFHQDAPLPAPALSQNATRIVSPSCP